MLKKLLMFCLCSLIFSAVTYAQAPDCPVSSTNCTLVQPSDKDPKYTTEHVSCNCVMADTPSGATDGVNNCDRSDYLFILEHGDASELTRLVNDKTLKWNKSHPDYQRFAYETLLLNNVFNNLMSKYYNGRNDAVTGCTPLHFIAARRCYSGNKLETIDATQVDAIKEMLTWGPVKNAAGRTEGNYTQPYAVNDLCQIGGYKNKKSLEIPKTILYLAVENLNPNVVEAYIKLYGESSCTSVSTNSSKYKKSADEKSVFMSEQKVTKIVNKDSNTPVTTYKAIAGYEGIKPNQGFVGLCYADFYNAFGDAVNDQRGLSRLAKNLKRRLYKAGPAQETFDYSLGLAVVYGLPIFTKPESYASQTTRQNIGKELDSSAKPCQMIDLARMDKLSEPDLAASKVILDKFKDIEAKGLSLALIKKHPEDRFLVNFVFGPTDHVSCDIDHSPAQCFCTLPAQQDVTKKSNWYYPNETAINIAGGIKCDEKTTCTYESAGVRAFSSRYNTNIFNILSSGNKQAIIDHFSLVPLYDAVQNSNGQVAEVPTIEEKVLNDKM